MKRRVTCAAVAMVLATVVAGCSSSGSEESAERSTTSAPPATTTTMADPSQTTPSSAVPTTTEPTAITALPACQDLLQQYTDAFTPDDLLPVAQLFRQWAPFMPDDVSAASLRIADAYEAAKGDLANLNMADQDLSEDAQVFSDWTNAGCPGR